MRRRDRGSISAFVVVVTIAVIACAGLVIDGARLVAAKVSAADHAENAARVGAQAVVVRDGVVVVDVPRARQRAGAYLASIGVAGTVSATAAAVSVTVQTTVSMAVLGVVGVGAKTVSATRTAQPSTA